MRHFEKAFYIFLACQFGALSLLGQEPTLKGRIVDSKSGAPIPFATILLKGIGDEGTFGLVSNTDGDFQIPVRYSERVDTLVISCIGFVTKKVHINQLAEERIQIFRLNEATLQLDEVEVRARKKSRITALSIVRQAIKSIPYNYPSNSESYVAYYRDYQLRDKKYINLNEAIVEVFDEGFQANDQLTTNMLLYDYKRNEEFERDSATEVPYDNHRTKIIPGARLYHYGGNELVILRVHDAIRNYKIRSFSFVGMLASDFVKNHKFNLDRTIMLNETPLYQISFYSKEVASGQGHIAKGTLFIEHNNYAIHKMEYTTYELDDGREKTLYDIQVEYSRGDASMRLNYLSFNNFFKLRDPKNFEVQHMTFDKKINALIIIFNKKPVVAPASDAQNYEIMYQGNKMVITKARVGDVWRGEPANSVYLYVHSFLFPKNTIEATRDITVQFKNIYDIEGRQLNDINFFPVNQFREIFVQKKTNPGPVPSDSLYVIRHLPLSESVKTSPSTAEKAIFWMNTPLKPAPEKPFDDLDLVEENQQ